MDCDCTWPNHLHQECEVHGIVKNCACGKFHSTMPLHELMDGVFIPDVCREHLQHLPCNGCERAVIRQAEQILFGAPRQGPTE